MSALRSILLTAASGNIGKVLAPLLITKDPSLKLVLPTTNAEKLKASNPVFDVAQGSNIVVEEGSIRDPIWFQSLLTKHNVDGVFLCVTGTDEVFTALNCLDAISKAGTVKKLIYLSICGDFVSETGMKDLFAQRTYAHIFAKAVVELKLLHARLPFAWTVLGPAGFFTNDYRQKISLLQGSAYNEPNIAKGWNRISFEDISLAASNVFLDTSNKWDGRKISLATKHSFTTTEVGELWSKALGKPIRTLPGGDDTLDMVEQNLRKALGPGVDGLAQAHDLRLMFESLMAHGFKLSDTEYQQEVELLGKEPDSYEDFIKVTAASWT